jgi:hypothetical protein
MRNWKKTSFTLQVNEGIDEGPALVKESLSEHETVKNLMQ